MYLDFLLSVSFRPLLDEWVELIGEILDKSKEACNWLVEYLSSSEGSSYIKLVLYCRDDQGRFYRTVTGASIVLKNNSVVKNIKPGYKGNLLVLNYNNTF